MQARCLASSDSMVDHVGGWPELRRAEILGAPGFVFWKPGSCLFPSSHWGFRSKALEPGKEKTKLKRNHPKTQVQKKAEPGAPAPFAFLYFSKYCLQCYAPVRFFMSTEFNGQARATRRNHIGGLNMKKKAIRILLWTMAVICVVPAAAMAQTFVVRWQARHFLQDIMRIRVGESDLAELQRLASKYRSFAVQDGPRCDQDLCSFDFYFGNRWLWRIGLASGTRFGGEITAQRGKITKIEVFLQTGISNSAQVVETPATPGSTPFRVTGKRATSEDTDYTVSKTIHLTADASQAGKLGKLGDRREVF